MFYSVGANRGQLLYILRRRGGVIIVLGSFMRVSVEELVGY